MKDINEQLSSKTVAIRPSGIRKFFDIVSTMKDAISLGVGEPDFDTPWPIREEGIYSLERGRTFYTSNSGLMELRSEICRFTRIENNIIIVVVCTGYSIQTESRANSRIVYSTVFCKGTI